MAGTSRLGLGLRVVVKCSRFSNAMKIANDIYRMLRHENELVKRRLTRGAHEYGRIAKYIIVICLSIILIEEPKSLYSHNVWMIEITDRRVGGDASYFRARLRSPYHISMVTRAHPIGSEVAAGQIRMIELGGAVMNKS